MVTLINLYGMYALWDSYEINGGSGTPAIPAPKHETKINPSLD